MLEDVLGGVLGGRNAGMQGSRGGFGEVLGGGIQGGSAQGGTSPIMMALMALLSQQMSGGGGLGGLLGGLTGQPSSGGMGQAGGSDWRGGQSGGMGGLLEQLEQNGHGTKARSWVGHGQNEPISPHELNDALGSDTVGRLSRQAGMSRDELLSQLSELLPDAVDKLTPQGRMPEQHEMKNW